MPLTVTSRAIAALWNGLRISGSVEPHAPTPAAVRRVVSVGWSTCGAVEDVLDAVDPQKVGPGRLSVRELLETYGIPLQTMFRRPRRSETSGIGLDVISAADLAHLLIQLEATGFEVDPTPLCEALRPQLGTRTHLTLAEMAVWWHPREQHRSSTKIVATGSQPTWGERAETLITIGGYRVELFRDATGTATALTADAPKWRLSRHLAAA